MDKYETVFFIIKKETVEYDKREVFGSEIFIDSIIIYVVSKFYVKYDSLQNFFR